MRSLRGVALVLLLAAGGCRVERTPSQYFDHRTSVEGEREAAAAELRDRLLAMGQALGRGNATETLIALSPADDVHVVGPAAGMEVSGARQLDAVLTSLLASHEITVEVRDVEVDVAPRGNVGWFRATLLLPGISPGDTPLRLTGVYVRDAGLWKLEQAHLSLPFSPQPADSASSPAAPAADSAGAAAARPRSPSRRGGT